MKQLITTALIIFFFNSCIAQKKGAFLRVFDNNDKQIYAGHLDGVTDSSFFLVIRRSKKEIPIREVNYLKLKHSVGHSIATVGGVSAVSLAIAGYFSGEPKSNNGTFEGVFHDLFTPTPAEGLFGGFVIGSLAGSAVGAIAGALKHKPVFRINKNERSWKEIKVALQKYLPKTVNN